MDIAVRGSLIHRVFGLGSGVSVDRYGRFQINVVGLGLTSYEWDLRMKMNGYRFNPVNVRDTLCHPDYNDKHRLEAGKRYTISLILGKEMSVERTTDNIMARGVIDYGRTLALRGELALLIREAVSDEVMARMGIRYIAVLHDPMSDVEGHRRVLAADSRGRGRSLHAYAAGKSSRWDDRGAFGYPVL